MSDLELALVGSGPHALTLLSYLAEHRPSTLEHTRVFDTADWLCAWHHQFARFGIPMLRSACVHHPHPKPYGLIHFARQHGRGDEFSGRIGRPSTELFADYCDYLLDHHHLRGLLTQSRVTDLVPLPGGGAEVHTGTEVVRARRVVLATNPVRPTVPTWLGDAWAAHGRQPGVMLSRDWEVSRAGHGPAVVVGGGLTAAQIVMAHASAGDRVAWVTRQPLRQRDLDVEATWLGGNLRDFHKVADPATRVAMARGARGGGSVPAAEVQQLRALASARLVHQFQAPVESIRRSGEDWEVTVRHQGGLGRLPAASVVCATGSQSTVRSEPLLRRCRSHHPASRVAGLPVLARDLSWPGTTVHLMGPLALTQVGPACRTVIGARIAAERMIESWGAGVERQYPGPR